MAKDVRNKVERYYDSHQTMEDLMGESSLHAELIHYLVEVLRWLFHEQACAIYENLNVYCTEEPKEYPVAPDIAVIKGAAYEHLRSWTIDENGSAPHVVFEIASHETWRNDLREKPYKYARMGIQEYYLYDAETPPTLKRIGKRLLGWQLDKVSGPQELQADAQGRLWSPHLNSLLVPDENYLRLYDRYGQLRLTGMEAETTARIAAMRYAEAEAEARRAEARKAQALAEKLRALGIDPDQL
jgi:Uma2 family endonuclease